MERAGQAEAGGTPLSGKVLQPAPSRYVGSRPPLAVAPGRRLLLDRFGNCFERRLDAAGHEYLVDLPRWHCDG